MHPPSIQQGKARLQPALPCALIPDGKMPQDPSGRPGRTTMAAHHATTACALTAMPLPPCSGLSPLPRRLTCAGKRPEYSSFFM